MKKDETFKEKAKRVFEKAKAFLKTTAKRFCKALAEELKKILREEL